MSTTNDIPTDVGVDIIMLERTIYDIRRNNKKPTKVVKIQGENRIPLLTLTPPYKGQY